MNQMNGVEKLPDFSDRLINVKIWGRQIKFVNLFKLTAYEHLQTLFVFMYIVSFWLCMFQIPTIVLLFTNWAPKLRYMYILYLCWMIYDRNTPYKEGRRWLWIKKLHLFRLYNDYFPVRLVKTAELTPDKNYILAVYPHGVAACGTLTTFGDYTNNIDKLYPNIDFGIVSLHCTINTPILRELFLSIGCRSPKISGIEYFINSKPSKALVIFPEGAYGPIFSRTGNEYFIPKNFRKGFIRVALKTGTSLVPVFSFGENNTLQVVSNLTGWLKMFSDILYKITRIRFICYHGSGLLQQSIGLMPRRVPITTVVGKPIPIPKVETPSEELVDEFQEKYFKELENLFEKYKHKYDSAGSNAKIKFI